MAAPTCRSFLTFPAKEERHPIRSLSPPLPADLYPPFSPQRGSGLVSTLPPESHQTHFRSRRRRRDSEKWREGGRKEESFSLPSLRSEAAAVTSLSLPPPKNHRSFSDETRQRRRRRRRRRKSRILITASSSSPFATAICLECPLPRPSPQGGRSVDRSDEEGLSGCTQR